MANAQSSWLDELDDASFRGVVFQVQKLTLRGGRRLANHQYPRRNRPNSEDMGSKQRTYAFTAFIDSTDGFAARDAFIDALDTDGSGLLVHPTHGQLQVMVDDWTLSEDLIGERNISRFALTFLESGDDVAITPTTDTAAAVSSAADAATTANSTAFAGTTSETWA
jgi:prophage DNA circulation protein